VRRFVKSFGLPVIVLPGGEQLFQPDDVLAWARSYRVPKTEEVRLAVS
jgi:hypothetical protein